MAVITFDTENNSVCVLVEQTDLINIRDENEVEISHGGKYFLGKVFVNGEIQTTVIRGERQ